MQSISSCIKTILFLSFFCFNYLNAQGVDKYTHNALGEKIYLQIDNEAYTTNKTIWFKAVILNAATHEPNLSSNVLYVELINAAEKIEQRKLIKVTAGIGEGFFDLDRSYEEGKYLIRAYTEWNKNFGDAFIFEKYIHIFSEKANKSKLDVVRNIRRIDTSESYQQFKLEIYPNLIDKTHDEELYIYLNVDGKKDSVTIDKTEKGKYVLDYNFPKDVELIDVEVKTKNNGSYVTSFSPDENYFDLQFFPEGGYLVDGLPSRIGFKAIGIDGLGRFLEGEILNGKDEVITSFKSNKLGMGNFALEKAVIGTNYKARIKLDNGDIKTVRLPEVSKYGNVMYVSARKDALIVSIASNYKKDRKVSLKGHARGYAYYNESVTLIDGRYVFVIPKNTFPEGVIAFTLYDGLKQPVSERLYFNLRPDDQLKLDASLSKNVFLQRERAAITIKTHDANNSPIKSNTSLLVVNKNEFGAIQSLRENILSFFLLSSDLKGEIEAPGAYFKTNTDLNIDDLMLTQGWSRYKYKGSVKNMSFEREDKLNVKGVINSRKSRYEKKNLDLMLMTFGENSSMYVSNVEVPGSFSFELDDLYGGNRDILIQGVDITEKEKKNYNIALRHKKPLPIHFNHKNTAQAKDSLISKVVEVNRDYTLKENEYYTDITGVTQLDEVIVDSYRMTPQRKKMKDKYGEPDVVIDGKEIKAKESKLTFGLYSVLRAFPEKIHIVRDSIGVLRAETTRGGKDHVTLIVVDGIPVMEANLLLVSNMATDEITSVEVIDNPRNLKQLFAEVNSGPPPPGPLYGSIISIYTKSGKGLFGALKTQETIDAKNIPVFSMEKEFYMPKHESDEALNPDLRFPLFWVPQIVSDNEGKATKQFYNSDITGEFLVILEAVSETGQIGYKELTYKVTENTFND